MIKIGELSNITGISIQAIRYYESEGLISPIEVDRWTNYRYYDESSVARLREISYLKELGFSLKEIKNLSEEAIQEKILQVKQDIVTLQQNIHKLSSIRKEKGGFIMKIFINDERVIGKWKKLAVVKEKEDFNLNKLDERSIFSFEEIYFLPKGGEYWIFSWSKGKLYVKDRKFPYEIIDGKMFIGIVDEKTNTVENYAVYEKIDDIRYKKEDIRVKDDTNIPFINDDDAIGFWEVVDFVRNFSQFDPRRKFWRDKLILSNLTFHPDGRLTTKNIYNKILNINWSKGVVINKEDSTVSEYTIKTIKNNDYMCFEWKSNDYIYGGIVKGYYILKRVR